MKKLHQHKKGYTLDDSQAHETMHRNWSRRQFLMTSGLAGIGTVALQGLPFDASASFSPNAERDDRILVLLKLNGGNDGLNTIIPYEMQGYYDCRPNIYVPENERIILDAKYAMPIEMQPLQNLWDNGNMAVIHNVNFTPLQYNRSHFARTKMWEGGYHHAAPNLGDSGWIGRYLDTVLPSFLENPPAMPAAINIGNYSNLTFKSGVGQMELSFKDAQDFYELVSSGLFYPMLNGSCPASQEVDFVRAITNSAIRYGEAVRKAYNLGINEIDYGNTIMHHGKSLAEQMAIVARLIKGGLGTPVYHVQINGFDTHANQNLNNWHKNLLGDTATLIDTFMKDLTRQGWQDKVIVMAYSEFGRTKKDNGSGTEHGESNVVMLFGESVNGNTYGDTPEFTTSLHPDSPIDNDTRPFQDVYATILDDWFCLDSELTDSILENPEDDATDTAPYDRVANLFSAPCNPNTAFGSVSNALLLGHNQKADDMNVVEIKYAIKSPGDVKLVLEKDGQTWDLVDSYHPKAGSFTHLLQRNQYSLLPGTYKYNLQAAGKKYSRMMQLY